MYKARNARNSLCSSTQFRLSTADAKSSAIVCETGQGYSSWSEENNVRCMDVVGPLTMSCIGDTVTNNKADAKSPPPVILTASRRQSFSYPKSTSSRRSVIFFTSQSHLFT